MKKAIFIAATGQNVGKTTLCLGIIAALRKRFKNIGFIKPVGQQHVKIEEGLNVDKDVVLFKEHFHLASAYADMSPIILPAGFTRDYLDGKVNQLGLEERIKQAFQVISDQHTYTVVEGTGHIGVGSIINMNNAKVASLLGLEVVIIASGGLGSAHDELALNIAMCLSYGVKVRGVILNRVLEDKRKMIEDYFPKALAHWGIPLIGCVPYNAFLNTPTLKDFELLFQTHLLAGRKYHYCHFPCHRLVAGSLEAYLHEWQPNELIITPASREDIILATLQKFQEGAYTQSMILTGRHRPSSFIEKKIQEADFPALYAPLCSYDAMKMITSFTAKIRGEDLPKIAQAIDLVEQNIDLNALISAREPSYSGV